MSALVTSDRGYVPPTYRAGRGAPWLHFLHGNVPGHQIDFIYHPEVPQGAFTQQHFSHLARLMKFIEPRPDSFFAFAIGNLSRDDTQHEPGHGGVAIILGMRVRGATGNAGRCDPPFAHGIAAVDRCVEPQALFRSAMQFYHRLLGEPGHERSGALWSMYSQFSTAEPALRLEALKSYMARFSDLPALARSSLSVKWTSHEALSKSVVITHSEEATFEDIVRCAARIASVLYRSNLRWSSITTGREGEIPNGVAVRIVPEREAGGGDGDTLVVPMNQLSADDADFALRLFGLSPFDASDRSSKPPVPPRELSTVKAKRSVEAPVADAQSNAGGNRLLGELADAAGLSQRSGGRLVEHSEGEAFEQPRGIGRPRRALWVMSVVAVIALSGLFIVMRGSGALGLESPAAVESAKSHELAPEREPLRNAVEKKEARGHSDGIPEGGAPATSATTAADDPIPQEGSVERGEDARRPALLVRPRKKPFGGAAPVWEAAPRSRQGGTRGD